MMVRCIIGPDPQSENIRTGRKAVDVTGKFAVLNLSPADGEASIVRIHGESGGSSRNSGGGSSKSNPSGTRISSTLRQDWLALPQVLLHWSQEGWQHLVFFSVAVKRGDTSGKKKGTFMLIVIFPGRNGTRCNTWLWPFDIFQQCLRDEPIKKF